METASVMSRLDSLEAILSAGQGGELGGVGALDCGGCCAAGGWDAAVELTLLKPVGASEINQHLGWELGAAPRLWVGYTACNGLGLRARYWQFDQRTTGTIVGLFGDTPVRQAFDLDVVDLEVTTRSPVGLCWDLLLAGGLCYVHREYEQKDDVFITSAAQGDYLGATVAAELRRPWGCGVSLYGTGRASVLIGDTDVLGFGMSTSVEDDIFAVFEGQLGLEWCRRLANGSQLYARLAGELQYWDAGFPEDRSFGLAGLAVGLGLLW
jgi:hypothetical protein